MNYLHLKFNIPQIQPISLPPIPHAPLQVFPILASWKTNKQNLFILKIATALSPWLWGKLKAKLCSADVPQVHRFYFSNIPFCSSPACLPRFRLFPFLIWITPMSAPSLQVSLFHTIPYLGLMVNTPNLKSDLVAHLLNKICHLSGWWPNS